MLSAVLQYHFMCRRRCFWFSVSDGALDCDLLAWTHLQHTRFAPALAFIFARKCDGCIELYAWAGNESTHSTLSFICSQLLQQILQLVVYNLSIAFSDDLKDIVLHCYAVKFLHDRSMALILSAEKDDCGRS